MQRRGRGRAAREAGGRARFVERGRHGAVATPCCLPLVAETGRTAGGPKGETGLTAI